MTITHRTCVGKAIIGKGQVIVSFAELDLQLVNQHFSGNCLSVTGHVYNIDNIENIDL